VFDLHYDCRKQLEGCKAKTTILGMPVIASLRKITAGTSVTPTTTRSLLTTVSTTSSKTEAARMLPASERCPQLWKCQQQQGGQQHISILSIYEKMLILEEKKNCPKVPFSV
jgi:hypothetical protein